jgi:uncharacterized protein
MEGVEAKTWETDDPQVVVTQITHHGQSNVTGAPYQFTALGVIRVRDGEIVRYDDYMDPIALARLLGRTSELAAALTTTAHSVTRLTWSRPIPVTRWPLGGHAP